MQVDALMVAEGAQPYYTDTVRNALEDFMTVLRNDSTTQPLVIEPGVAQRFKADLYGLLTFLRIPPQFHYAIMRVNKLTSSDEYHETMLTLYVPETAEIQRIMQVENSANRTTN